MFCCLPDTLYLNLIQNDPYDVIFEEQQISLKQKIKQSQNQQILLPRVMHLSSAIKSQSSLQQIDQNLATHQVSFSQQARQLTIQELIPNPQEKIWRVLQQNQEQTLNQGQNFSFDGLNFQVYKISSNPNPRYQSKQTQSTQKCRICLGSQVSQQNPLLNFCNCTGSIKYMHLQCCRQWLIEDIQPKSESNYSLYEFKNTKCNICNQDWKSRIKSGKIQYFLYDFQIIPHKMRESQMRQRPTYQIETEINGLYLLFFIQNALQLPEGQQYQRLGLMVLRVMLNVQQDKKYEEVIKIGNHQSSKVRLSYLFLSPVNFSIKLKNNKLTIKDEGSLFGTSVQLKSIRNCNFNTKDGVVIKYEESYMYIKGKNKLFRCLQPQIGYKIKFKPYKKVDRLDDRMGEQTH